MFSFMTRKHAFESQREILREPRDHDIEIEGDWMRSQVTSPHWSQRGPADVEMEEHLRSRNGREKDQNWGTCGVPQGRRLVEVRMVKSEACPALLELSTGEAEDH